ncbi:MAG TPA: SRPBCC family protein [Candidatus Bathyarchaeia archaeon]|nr:SRPBCC family protein [Candidatus Bathyarchaeia archaeon]
MIKIAKTSDVTASIEQVWNTISNLENEKRYWPVIKNIKILSRNGNTIEREATIMRGPLGSVKSLQTLSLESNQSIILKMTKGGLIGTRKISLSSLDNNRTRIDVVWDFDLVGIPIFAESFVKNRISEITADALRRIAEDCQGFQRLKT